MKVGLFYDWDLTLTEEYQQLPIFRKYLGKLRDEYGITKAEDYWELCQRSEIGLGYMEQMIKDAQDIFEGLTNERMEKEFANQVKLAPGLPGWFERINAFGKKLGIKLEHHVISVGILPLIKGTSVFPYLASLTSGEFLEDDGRISGIKRVVHPFRKVAFLKTICKGGELYKTTPLSDYDILHKNSIVLGDGLTDMDMFRYLRQRGGIAIAVFERGNPDNCKKLVKLLDAEDFSKSSVSIIAPRDYSENSNLEIAVKKAIQAMVDSQGICSMDYELVHNVAMGHLENEEVAQIVRKHFSSCTFCQEKYYPQIYQD